MTSAGEAPNAIPEQAEGRWYIRAETLAGLDEVEPRVRRCFQAGALATGCELDIDAESTRYSQFRNDRELLGLFAANARGLGRAYGAPGSAGRMNRAPTDMGNVSLRIPAIHPHLGIASLPAVNHQREFATRCVWAAARQAVLDGAAALALTIIDAASTESVRDRLLRTYPPVWPSRADPDRGAAPWLPSAVPARLARTQRCQQPGPVRQNGFRPVAMRDPVPARR